MSIMNSDFIFNTLFIEHAYLHDIQTQLTKSLDLTLAQYQPSTSPSGYPIDTVPVIPIVHGNHTKV